MFVCLAACYFVSIIVNDIIITYCCQKYVPFEKTAPKKTEINVNIQENI
jgi:hypothetical protein